MMRRASSASLACTAMRTSPRPSTDSGKTTAARRTRRPTCTPCASSRPRTMLRFDVGVRAEDDDQIATQSSAAIRARSPRADVVDLQQDHRHVVVLRRVADERRDLAQHALAQLLRRQVRVLLDQPAEPRLAEADRRARSSPR